MEMIINIKFDVKANSTSTYTQLTLSQLTDSSTSCSQLAENTELL